MRRSVFAVLALVAVSSSVACGSAPEALPALGADGGPAPVGSEGPRPGASASPDGGGTLPGREPAPPAPAPKADQITEQFGVFVAKDGAAQNPGTRKSPLASITEAIAKAKADKKSVFVCEGTYEETLEIANGVSIIGGFDCSGSEWKQTNKKSVLDSASSPAIHADKISTPTRIDGFDVKVPDATTPSGSSIAVIVLDSNALTFANGTITAGAGMKGDDGVEGEQLALVPVSAPGGGTDWMPAAPVPREHLPGGAGAVGKCVHPDGSLYAETRGGSGCTSGIYTRPYANVPWSRLEAPRYGTAPTPSTRVVHGIDGASGTMGSFGAEGFSPADGAVGTSGSLGMGGYGGFSDDAPPPHTLVEGYSYGVARPGGGLGGCPGLAGTAGKGGGASIGILAIRSPLRLDSLTVTSAAGGAGGKGTFGSRETNGTNGAYDGSAQAHSKPGEAGGRAGVSGSGAGGPSIGIAHEGGAPVLTASTATAGAAGEGVGAQVSGAKTLPASAEGESVGVKAL